jgi:type IV fimbrial biogenesis protein FimT
MMKRSGIRGGCPCVNQITFGSAGSAGRSLADQAHFTAHRHMAAIGRIVLASRICTPDIRAMKNPWNTRRTRAIGGFTLLELMVAITVLAVLLGLGIPSFSSIIQRNRLTAEVNELITALNYARSEAGKRGTRISVCGLDSAGTNCDITPSWQRGWMMFVDDGATNGELDTGEEILQVWPATAGAFSYDASVHYVGFSPMRADAAATLDVYKGGCSGPEKREIQIQVTGRISSKKVDC